MRSPLPARLTAALVVVLLALGAACSSGPADAQGRLAGAVGETFSGELAYRLTVDADPSALDSLGDGVGGAADLLADLEIAGVVEGDRATSVAVTVLGEAPVFELRAIHDQGTYLRLRLADLLASTGRDVAESGAALRPVLEMLGLSARVQEVVVAALDGQWVGVQGPVDTQALRALVGEPTPAPGERAEAQGDVRDAFGEGLADFLERYVDVVDEREGDGEIVYDVEVAVADLVRALVGLGERPADPGLTTRLDDLPEIVPATVVVRDGLVTSMALDIAAAARAGGEEVDGAIRVELDLFDHGAVTPVAAPDAAETLTGEQFDAVVERLATLGSQFPAG